MAASRHLRLLLFCLATAGSASAQVAGQRPADFAPTQRLFDAYRTRAVHLWADPVLGQIHARQLKPTAANVASVIELLAGHLPQDDKVELARILGDLYTRDDQSGHNAQIASRLQDVVRNGEKPVALAALFAYSGLDDRVDTVELLDYGLRKGLIDADSYCQQLVLGLPRAAAPAQLAAARRLAAMNNAFGALALSGIAESVVKLSPESRKLILQTLEKREPQMPAALGYLGYVNAISYADWLHCIALLSESLAVASYDSIVLAHLDDATTDPRKILAYLTAPQGRRMMQRVGRRAPFERPAARALDAARHFPDHPIMTPLAVSLNATLATLMP